MGELLPISALQHLLYCKRQCALIHLDREWSENRFTAEGQVLHQRAHEGPSESRPGVRTTRGMSVVCHELGLVGQCDVVEFHRSGEVIPVEYKRGRPKEHRADEVQLCAQAIALEEMLSVEISVGYLYYGEKRRRTTVTLDAGLRALTAQTARSLRELLSGESLPPPIHSVRLCNACSLVGICQPRSTRSAARWFSTTLTGARSNREK